MPKVNLFFSLLLSLLMLIGVLFFSANGFALNTAQIIILCFCAAAWLVLFLFSRNTHSSPKNSIQNTPKTVGLSVNSLIESLKKELAVQLTAANAELSQTKSLIDDAINDLVDSFISLEASARIEQKLVMLLASNEAENDQDELNPFREKQLKSKQLLDEIAEKLNTIIKNIVKNEVACKSLNNLESETASSVTALEKLLDKMTQNNQPDLVEDVRAQTKQLHQITDAAIKKLSKMKTDSKAFAAESIDISQKINEIINEHADNVSIVFDELAVTSLQIEKDVQTAIRSLQFQDMTTQLITQCGERQKIMQDILNAISGIQLGDNLSLAQLQEKLDAANSELQQAGKVRMKQFNVDGGSVELF